MQVQFKLTIGSNEFTIVDDIESQQDFFKKLSFYSTLPKVGPNGETDLVLRHRVAQQGKYNYYSIVSEQAGQEFKLGQSKVEGGLFPKGWEPIYRGTSEEESAQTGNVGLGGPVAQPAVSAPSAGLGTVASVPTPAPAPAANPQVQQQAANILSKFGI